MKDSCSSLTYCIGLRMNYYIIHNVNIVCWYFEWTSKVVWDECTTDQTIKVTNLKQMCLLIYLFIPWPINAKLLQVLLIMKPLKNQINSCDQNHPFCCSSPLQYKYQPLHSDSLISRCSQTWNHSFRWMKNNIHLRDWQMHIVHIFKQHCSTAHSCCIIADFRVYLTEAVR